MDCARCDGKGRVLVKDAIKRTGPGGEDFFYDSMDPCPECAGAGPMIATRTGSKENLRDRTREWIRTHPIAAALFKRFAEELRVKGARFGISLITERIRWECKIEGYKLGDYKIQNSFRAYIARWLIDEDPRLEKLIERRETKW